RTGYKHFFADVLAEGARDDVGDVRRERFRRAIADTVDFIEAQMPGVPAFEDKYALLDHALTYADHEGLHLEFGVYRGVTLNHVAARRPEQTLYGFDSFEGLPESWGIWRKGAFDTRGQLPKVRPNVRLIKGWFDETLPAFVAEHRQRCSFVHVDSDIYSSARTVFQTLSEQIRPGTVIVFDEYFGYPHWREGEHKALLEFAEATGLDFTYIGYCDRDQQVAVRIHSSDDDGEAATAVDNLKPSAVEV
ncbi:MAG: class I SAM-dependent methyltransferase, partial [Phycisphaeraceae bacterium]